jgi:hypothetical protein
MREVIKAMQVIFVAQIAEKNHAPNAEVAAPAVMSSMRFTANSMKFAIKFAMSKKAKRNKIIALPLSRPELMITVISLIYYKSM